MASHFCSPRQNCVACGTSNKRTSSELQASIGSLLLAENCGCRNTELLFPALCCYCHIWMLVTASVVVPSLHRWKWGGPRGGMLISLSIQLSTLWTVQSPAAQRHDWVSDRQPCSSSVRGGLDRVTVALCSGTWPKNSAAPSEPLPKSQFLCHHTQEKQFKDSAGVGMPAKLLTAVPSIASAHLLWQTQIFKNHKILTWLNSLLRAFD